MRYPWAVQCAKWPCSHLGARHAVLIPLLRSETRCFCWVSFSSNTRCGHLFPESMQVGNLVCAVGVPVSACQWPTD